MKGEPTIQKTTRKKQTGKASLKTLIEASLDADKAMDIVTMDLENKSVIADHIIVASGTSSRHVAAIAEKLRDRLSMNGYKNIRIEGIAQADWVVVDAGDAIIHIFKPEVRSFYNIEKMWGYAVPLPSGGGMEQAYAG